MPFNPYAPITQEVIAELLRDRQPEDRTLEYKQALPGTSTEDRNEFLADVTAMANTSGGAILFGVEEERIEGEATARPKRVCGLPGVNVEEHRHRMEQWLKSNVTPNIPGVHLYSVDGAADAPVLVVKIPRSWAAPHMVKNGRWSGFFGRGSVGKHELDWQAIRGAFVAGEGERERIERFRNDRIGKIVSNAVGWTLPEGARLVLHVVPFGSVQAEAVVDVKRVERQSNLMHPMGRTGGLHRYIFEGALNYVPVDRDTVEAYTLLFREGIVESVYSSLVQEHDGRRLIPSVAFERIVLERLPGYVQLLADHGRSPPYLVMLAATSVKGAELDVDTSRFIEIPATTPIARDELVFPAVIVDEQEADFSRLMKPVFDAFWNAAGWAGSRNYDKDGNRSK